MARMTEEKSPTPENSAESLAKPQKRSRRKRILPDTAKKTPKAGTQRSKRGETETVKAQTSKAKTSKAKSAKAKSAKARTAKARPAVDKKPPRPPKPLGRYSAQEIRALFERFHAANPSPQGELEHSNAFTLVVAVVLSAQATDVSVNKACRELFRLADSPQKMLALGEYRVSDLIKTIGLFRTKAKNVIALSQMLIDDYDGEVPATREALMRLPGVGQKTANVVLNTAFGQPTIAVDTHIFRLANRLGLAPGRTPALVEAELDKVIPDEFKRDSHHWLILHGRYVCKARSPDCSHCIIADLCKYEDKTSDVAYPIPLKTVAP